MGSGKSGTPSTTGRMESIIQHDQSRRTSSSVENIFADPVENNEIGVTNTERELPVLPDVDTSSEAWLYVIASFMEEMLLWAPLFCTGVYLKYYAESEIFSSASETQISLIGTLSPFFAYATGMPLLYLYNYFPRSMIPSMWAGLALYSISLLAASFVSNIHLLILFQGVGPGIAAALGAFPIIRWIPEWFDKRKGIATGVIFAGGGVGGVYYPFLYELFLDKLGYKWSLRIFAIASAVIGSISTYFVKPRVPISSKVNIKRMPMPSFSETFFSWGFLCIFISSLLQSFGYFNVALFLPRFSDTLSSSAGAGLLAAFNVSCLISQILWGHITDKINPTLAMSSSSGIGSILVLFLWGFNQESLGLKVLMPFSIVFGLTTGGFSSMWSQCSHDLAGDSGLNKDKQSLLWSGLSVARGLGAIIGPTIGSALYRSPAETKWKNYRWGSAGSPPLIALVAASLAASALILVSYALGRKAIEVLSKDEDRTSQLKHNIGRRKSGPKQRISSTVIEMDIRSS